MQSGVKKLSQPYRVGRLSCFAPFFPNDHTKNGIALNVPPVPEPATGGLGRRERSDRSRQMCVKSRVVFCHHDKEKGADITFSVFAVFLFSARR